MTVYIFRFFGLIGGAKEACRLGISESVDFSTCFVFTFTILGFPKREFISSNNFILPFIWEGFKRVIPESSDDEMDGGSGGGDLDIEFDKEGVFRGGTGERVRRGGGGGSDFGGNGGGVDVFWGEGGYVEKISEEDEDDSGGGGTGDEGGGGGGEREEWRIDGGGGGDCRDDDLEGDKGSWREPWIVLGLDRNGGGEEEWIGGNESGGWGDLDDEFEGWDDLDDELEGWGDLDDKSECWGDLDDEVEGWGDLDDEFEGWGDLVDKSEGWDDLDDESECWDDLDELGGWGDLDDEFESWGDLDEETEDCEDLTNWEELEITESFNPSSILLLSNILFPPTVLTVASKLFNDFIIANTSGSIIPYSSITSQ